MFCFRILCIMALTTGNNKIFSSVVQHHFQPGMKELVSFAQSLIEAGTDLSVSQKMKGHIAKASEEMDEALEELKWVLSIIDANSVQLVAQKKCLEEERQAQALEVSNLRYELDSHRSQESKSREMLETAREHLKEMQRQLSQREEEVQYNQQMRDTAIGLMFIIGTIAGSVMVGGSQTALVSAQNAKREAEAEVNRHAADVDQHWAEANRLQALIQEAERNVWTSQNRISSIEAEKKQLVSQQAEVVAFQNTLRKCVTFLAVLAGKVDMAEFLSRDVVIYNELEGILKEILDHVFPLMGQGMESYVMALSTSEIRALIEKLKSAKEKLSLEGPRPG